MVSSYGVVVFLIMYFGVSLEGGQGAYANCVLSKSTLHKPPTCLILLAGMDISNHIGIGHSHRHRKEKNSDGLCLVVLFPWRGHTNLSSERTSLEKLPQDVMRLLQ